MLPDGKGRGFARTQHGSGTVQAAPARVRRRFGRGLGALLLPAGVLLAMILAAAVPTPADEDADEDADGESPPAATGRPMPLVPIDEELDEYLHRAVDLIANGQYGRAVEILQSLITSGSRVFHQPQGSTGRFVSIQAAATEVLGTLPDEGLALYRQLYDAKAGALLREAERSGDETLLRRVAEEYFQTTHGDRAMNLLGAMRMDEGRFLEAAYHWDAALRRHRGGTMDAALLAAKAATAYHLGGAAARAGDLLALLRSKYPQAEGTIAGTHVNLVSFVEKTLAAAPPPVLGAPESPAGWPSFAGSPTGLALMSACDKATLPLWRHPTDRDDTDAVLGFAQMTGSRPPPAAVRRRAQQLAARVKDGQVVVSCNVPGRQFSTAVAPPMIHPIVAGGLVLYRSPDEVVACDLQTGAVAWKSAPLPLYARDLRQNWIPQLASMGMMPGDAGKYTLTLGGDHVYALAKFISVMPMEDRIGAEEARATSCLVAISIRDRGKIVWEVGGGKGSDDLARRVQYLTAPTYRAGKLYAIARHSQSYHAICLDAQTGTAVWDTPVGQAGSAAGPPWEMPGMLWWAEQGTPPAVADGRVYVTPNAGLISCLAADSGQPVWSYQYETARSAGERRQVPRPPGSAAFPYPPNPIIAAEGLVICLPADHEKVVALASASGELVWEADRLKQQNLTAIGPDRLLLSGGNLIVLRARDGTTAFAARDIDEIVGRPAASADSVVASGRGRLYRLDLKTYAISRTPVFDEVGLLGGLVGAEGRLVAANAAGVCAYFTYPDAWKVLEGLLATAGRPAERFKVRLKRGQFALLAGELDQARNEFRAADTEADAADQDLKSVLRLWRHRLAIRCAERADQDEAVGRFLQEAGTLATGPTSEAELLLRQMAYHEKFGRFAEAVRVAQTLADKFPETPVHDVLASTADGAAWPNDDDPTIEGYVLGQREVRRLITAHGKDVYAAFDALAARALDQGKAAADAEALLTAAARYPHSAWADRLLLAAAENLYRRAGAGPSTDRRALERAAGALGGIRNRPDTTVLLEARVGEALVDARLCPQAAAVLHQDLRAEDASAPVRFADFHGQVSQVVSLLEAEARAAAAEPPRFPRRLGLPLREAYRVKGTGLAVLRGGDGEAARIGPRVFLQHGQQVVCLDTRRDTYEAAKVWTADSDAPSMSPPIAYVTAGCREVAVCSHQSLALLEAATGKVVYREPLAKWGTADWSATASDGRRLYFVRSSGDVVCVNLADGQTLWCGASERPRGQMHALSLEGDVLLAQSVGMPREIRCYDARTGRLLYQEVANQTADAELTPDGLLLLAAGDRAKLCDPYRMEAGPLWETAVSGASGRNPLVLGASRNHAALLDNHGSRTVRILDLTRGTVAAMFATKNADGNPVIASEACFDGDRAYVICGNSSPSRYYNRGILSVLAPSIQAVGARSGKVLWSTSVAPNQNTMCFVKRLIVLDDHLVAFVICQDNTSLGEWSVLSKETGAVVLSAEGTDDDLDGLDKGEVFQRRFALGAPVVMNGRMLVELPTGIRLLRSPL